MTFQKASIAFIGLTMLCGVAHGVQEPPAELKQTGHGAYGLHAIDVPTKQAIVEVNQLEKTVTVKRVERQNTTSPWSKKNQELSHSFLATDVQAERSATTDEILSLVVSGTYDNGISTIERWRFVYPQSTPGAPYVPLASRPLPAVQRSVLFMGTSLGHIASVAIDREARFLIVLTLESHSIYKMSLTAPFAPVVLFTPTQVPALTDMRQVSCTHHITEGRQYHFVSAHRFGANVDVDKTLIMRDAQNSGVFATPVGYTDAQLNTGGYNLLASYVLLCGRWE